MSPGPRLILALATASILLVGAPSRPAEAGGERRCVPRNADVVEASRVAVVYRFRHHVFGCYRPTGERHDFGSTLYDPDAAGSCTSDVVRARLAGGYAAYGFTDACRQTRYYVERFDLATGMALASQPSGSCDSASRPCPELGVARPSRIVVTRRASIAWISGNDSTTQVWRYDGRGRDLLAEGTDIDRSFLSRRGGTVAWRQGGRVQQASLSP